MRILSNEKFCPQQFATKIFSMKAEQSPLLLDVVIVGAGVAGLACAAKLIEEDPSISILILEARDRIGGRVYTTIETRTDVHKKEQVQFAVDHGAAWVHGIDENDKHELNPMLELLSGKSAGDDSCMKRLVKGNPWTRPYSVLQLENEMAIFRNGTRLDQDAPKITQAAHQHYNIMRQISQYINKQFEEGNGAETAHQSLADAIRRIEAEIGPTDGDVNKADDTASIQDLIGLYRFLIECWNGSSTSDRQLMDFLQGDVAAETDEVYTPQGDFPGAHCSVEGGMRRVVEALRLKMPENIIIMEQVVTQIKDGSTHVQLRTSAGLTVNAKRCVLTIPLGCLQKAPSSLFDPPLSQDKVEAINSLASGSYKKIFLTFDHIFWPKNELFITLIRKEVPGGMPIQLGRFLIIDNLWARQDIPCFEAILSGENGRKVVGASDETIRDCIISFVEECMHVDNLADHLVDVHVTRWEEDPFSQGSYSSFRLGTTETHIRNLKQSEWRGRLLFAGEATDEEYMGSVHAALRSGHQAARSIQACLN